jgi:restriction endonuclease S subunit
VSDARLESLGDMTRLKHVSTVQTGVTLSGKGDLADPEWPYLRVANVQVGYVDLSEIKTVRVPLGKAIASMLRPGDVLMTEGGDVDKLWRGALWRGELPDMLHQNHIFAVRPDEALDSQFLVYWLDGPMARTYFRTTAKQTTNLAGTNKWTLGNLPLPVPPLNEQRRIVAYLDRETARIDALIEEQQRLVKMLRERRADLISHAVLDATSQRTQLRRLVDVIDCAHVTAEFVADDYRFPVASIRECQGVTVDLTACNYTTAEFFEHLRAGDRAPRAGDLLFIRNVSVGLVSVVTSDLPEFAIGQETVLLRRTSDVHPAFLRYALVGAEARHAIEGAMIGTTFRRINVSAIRSIPVPTPLMDEQRRIAAQLDQKTAKTDTLISETERFIELSKERRSALITAAVTGQVDVREMA